VAFRTLYLDVRTRGFQVFFAVFFFLNFKVCFFFFSCYPFDNSSSPRFGVCHLVDCWVFLALSKCFFHLQGIFFKPFSFILS
jgi:hypothetical protein